MEPLAFLGKPDHEESEKEDQRGDDFCKLTKRSACKRGFVSFKVSHHDLHQQFTGCCLAA
jgi:hypothetical protein